jgi:hypothetical protein
MTAPPPRPIISGSGAIMENMGKFVEHHIKNVANKHQSYIQDTPHFLRILQKQNRGPKLEKNAILVTMDVKALFTNIQHNEGLKSLSEALEQRENIEVPSAYIVRLMEILLKHNIFLFNEEYFIQQIGAPMGSAPVPSYANIFMAEFDEAIRNRAGAQGMQLLTRFLDDYFLLYCGTTKKLHQFLEEINQINTHIQLTMNHTSIEGEATHDRCQCQFKRSVPFLDTLCTIKNGKIETDLYRKETDRNQYLLPESCHPKQCTRSLPFSLALRLVRICSEKENLDKRLVELKGLLLERGYKQKVIESAFDRARSIPREAALRKVNKKKSTDRPVFAVTYDPRLPSITSAQAHHWGAMVAQDPYLAEVFPQPPLTAFKRQKNVRDHLIRAQVAKSQPKYQKRELKGMVKCTQNCTACPYIKEGKSIKINKRTDWKINKKVDCNSYNIVYLIECNKNNCKEKYIGETKRPLKFRLADHRGYIVNKNTNQATGLHFNLPGHSLANLKITVIEQVKKRDEIYRKEREKFYISKFNTYYNGMNRQPH